MGSSGPEAAEATVGFGGDTSTSDEVVEDTGTSAGTSGTSGTILEE